MKIILMGQQAFGKSALEKFHTETNHDVVAVYCAPDKEGKPADPVKFEIVFNLSLVEYSEKNSSFFGIMYPSILNSLNLFLNSNIFFFII